MRIQVNFDSLEEFQSFFHSKPGSEATTERSFEPDAERPTPAPVQETSAPAQTAPIPTAPLPTAPLPTEPAPTQAVPTTPITYKRDDLVVAAVKLMDRGYQADLQALLAQFGVRSMPDLTEDQFGAFATALRGMGAEI